MEKNDAIKLYLVGSSAESLQWLVIIFAIVNVLIIIGTVLFNLVALITLVKQRTLHNPSNTLLGAMCVGNLASALLVHAIYEHMLGCLRSSATTCITHEIVAIFHANFTACKGITSFVTAMVSVDRYMAICHPFKYLGTATIKKYIWITAIFSGFWVAYSLCLILILPLKLFYGSITVIIFCSMAAMNFCYTRILAIVHHQRVRVQTVGEIEGTVSSPQMREKSKAMVILVEIFTFNIFNLPLFIFAIYYLVNGFDGSFTTPFVLMNLGYTLSNATCFFNVFVYCFRSTEVRKAAKTLIPQKMQVLQGYSRARNTTKVTPVGMWISASWYSPDWDQKPTRTLLNIVH